MDFLVLLIGVLLYFLCFTAALFLGKKTTAWASFLYNSPKFEFLVYSGFSFAYFFAIAYVMAALIAFLGRLLLGNFCNR